MGLLGVGLADSSPTWAIRPSTGRIFRNRFRVLGAAECRRGTAVFSAGPGVVSRDRGYATLVRWPGVAAVKLASLALLRGFLRMADGSIPAVVA
jgi:hypothetical protein